MESISFPIFIQTMVVEAEPNTRLYYPRVTHLPDPVKRKINETIYQMVEHLYERQFIEQQTSEFAEALGTYEVKLNERHLLSITLSNYSIAPQAANGLTMMEALTFDTETGKTYTLSDLFQPDSNYIEILSTIIQKQITDRNIPTNETFTEISPTQSFYLTDKCLILFFQALVFTPHYVGIPVFPISIFELEEIINEEGPLARLLPTV
ncbi:RsiV family protein [Pseudogracilibacillus sp. ICA-222130]|uniref:RsiV family protein n=1 Tax=Pseudogracilibacillus sp. ICA-222130 TaxID=3134655 RepID=UPI0030C3193E